ncbi:MAG TPA: hypothetical protein VFE37_14005 [Chloroflexota bacterium]|nr:hypothetical protein [Chloroflexota bacterium]
MAETQHAPSTEDISTEVQVARARLAALRQDPRVIVHERTTDEPYEPVIQGTPEMDVLEVLGRRDDLDELPDDPA